MKRDELDRRLREFEKKHPATKKRSKRTSLDKFVSDIEKQLNRLEKKR